MREFDRKFGVDFLSSVPLNPGVYRFLGKDGEILYVGKAIRLRRRLQQYRNASRLKRHQKMRKIFKAAGAIEFEVCDSHREACLRELSLIQTLRPPFNVSGAFAFLYPMIGVSYDGPSGRLSLYLTNAPEKVVEPGIHWHGAYRSRSWSREFFWSLVDLLEFSAHREPAGDRTARIRGVSAARFRRVEADWVSGLNQFLSGSGARDFLEHWILQLVENAGARSRGAWVQEKIRALHTFQKHECSGLLRARQAANYNAYPVPQWERDRVFLEARLARETRSSGARALGGATART
jgi:excinuclease ABC subunit C